jgi:hypothetical protein
VDGHEGASSKHQLRDFHHVRVDPTGTIGSSDRGGKPKRFTMGIKVKGGGIGGTRKERVWLEQCIAAPLIRPITLKEMRRTRGAGRHSRGKRVMREGA